MKLKNFFLGVSLALCGAAFGQQEATCRLFIPEYNVTLFASSCEITEDDQ